MNANLIHANMANASIFTPDTNVYVMQDLLGPIVAKVI